MRHSSICMLEPSWHSSLHASVRSADATFSPCLHSAQLVIETKLPCARYCILEGAASAGTGGDLYNMRLPRRGVGARRERRVGGGA
jgi:hypothetical protein